jgi:transcriptional regulator with XRE-family HTH domain
MDIDKAFGLAVREFREKNHYSQEELADLCDFDRTYISLIEHGKRSPTLRNIGRFRRGLNITWRELFDLMEKYHRSNK